MISIKILIKSILPILSLVFLAIFTSIFLGNEKHMLISIISAIITCIPFFIRFENSHNTSREVVMISVMIALCIAGRFIFSIIPHFKPVTALVIITGVYFGSEAGFITGSMTALLSNMQHGQGPWTVFQMAAWGLIGTTAGLLSRKSLLKNRYILLPFSGICGILYSSIMDIYTTISVDSTFSIERYISYVIVSMPVMLEYIASNVIFILILEKPIGKKLARIKTKYGIFQ